MTLTIEPAYVAMAGSIVVSAVITFWRAKENSDNIRDLWAWKNVHEKDSNSIRFSYTERFGNIEGSIREKTARDEDIIRRLERLEDLLSQLIQGQKEHKK